MPPLKFAPAITATAASAKIPDYSTAFRADFFTPRLVLPAFDHLALFVVAPPQRRPRRLWQFVLPVLRFP